MKDNMQEIGIKVVRELRNRGLSDAEIKELLLKVLELVLDKNIGKGKNIQCD